MPFVQEVDAKVKELRQTIANLNNKQMSLRTTLKKLKEKTVEMDDKVSLSFDRPPICFEQQWKLSFNIMSYIIFLIFGFFEQYIEEKSIDA
jgi:predicted nuclease with TOPRIM domain